MNQREHEAAARAHRRKSDRAGDVEDRQAQADHQHKAADHERAARLLAHPEEDATTRLPRPSDSDQRSDHATDDACSFAWGLHNELADVAGDDVPADATTARRWLAAAKASEAAAVEHQHDAAEARRRLVGFAL